LEESRDASPKAVLVCGLGLLGQHCAVVLKELGVPVYGLHEAERTSWETEGMPHALDRFTAGDYRRHSVLERAGIGSCRAVLFTGADERANITGALAARSLNPDIRLVIRSSQTNLNERLDHQLGNLMALDIAELPATAFSLAAMGDETVGLLSLDGQFLRVVVKRIDSADGWAHGRELHDLNTRWRRVLHHSPAGGRWPVDFHGWDPGERAQPGDLLAYIEFYETSPAPEAALAVQQGRRSSLSWNSLRTRAGRFWTHGGPVRRIAALTAAALILIHATGVLLYKLQYPETSLLDAFNVATVLIFDGYSNMFAQLKLPFRISLWMLLFSLMMTMAGAVVTGMLYAFLTARVLSARLDFRRRPARIPRAGHVVVIGMGPLGRRVAGLLVDLDQPVVAVSNIELDHSVLPKVPVIQGDPRESLGKANAATAASVMALTDDDVSNLELALMSAQINQNCRLVVRTDEAEFARSVMSLAPKTHAMSVNALSAEAFAAGALGENVLHLLRIGDETILTTEFRVEYGDTFQGRLLGDVTCGYGLAAVVLQRAGSDPVEFFPSEDIRLGAGDRLVVLATIGGLQSAEHGVTAERTHRVRVLKVVSDEAAFEGARAISRISGCNLGTAGALFHELPAVFPELLFRHQARRLARELTLSGVSAEVVPAQSADQA
jgi:Trk K+ transport system NAD-binding subunit